MAELDHATDFSGHLLAAAEVRGAPIYNTTLEQVAFVEDLLLDKFTGRLVYAVLKFGGHFGVGCHYHSLPWEKFSYNTELGGYIIDIDHNTLEKGSSRANLTKPRNTQHLDDDGTEVDPIGWTGIG